MKWGKGMRVMDAVGLKEMESNDEERIVGSERVCTLMVFLRLLPFMLFLLC